MLDINILATKDRQICLASSKGGIYSHQGHKIKIKNNERLNN